MPLILDHHIALIIVGALGVAIFSGCVFCWRCVVPYKTLTIWLSYAISISPMAILLWNCVAIAYLKFNGIPVPKLEPTILGGVSLLTYSAAYTMIHVTNDFHQSLAIHRDDAKAKTGTDATEITPPAASNPTTDG